MLAGILLNVVPEFKGLIHSEVIERIESSKIDEISAELLTNEDVDESQKILYDIVVNILVDRETKINGEKVEKTVHLIFDLEMQRKFNADYPLMNRAIYYVSRLFAKQRIKHANYSDLVPVQSAWICIYGINKKLQNRHLHFEYSAFDGFGNPCSDVKLEGQDLTRIDLLLLSEDYNWDQEDPVVIKFLQSIFHNNLNNKDFNPYVDVDPEISKEVRDMILENEQYNVEMASERAEGRAEERESLILNAINNLKSQNIDNNKILETLSMVFGLKVDEIKYYLEKSESN